MPGHDIIVVGASAGGLEALIKLVCSLPPDLPAALFVVIHIPAHSKSLLPSILNRALKKRHKDTSLQALQPQHSEAIQQGRIYVAPPDHHLLVKDNYVYLSRGPSENSHRPAVDPLFRTAARAHKQRVVGIVLSGTLDDGTAGLAAVKQQGGIAIAQNPGEALYSGMPLSAIENVDLDYVLPVSEIAAVLVELAYKPPAKEEGAVAVSSDIETESDMAELEVNAMQHPERPGTPSPFGCPECGGVLWELQEGKLVRFRCRTGHAYSTRSLLAEQSDALEEALWSALRALEEKAALAEKLAAKASDNHQHISAKRFQEQGNDSRQRAVLVRNLLINGNGQSLNVNGQLAATPHDRSTSLVLVVIAASAGGIKALGQLLAALPANFPAAIAVVQHLSRQHPSQLADILNQRTSLTVKQAEEGDLLQPGKVYIAPPNQHLLVNQNQTLALTQTQLVHFVRPSANLLFESAAASLRERAIALVLTGTGKDGAMGVEAIKKMGGTVIVQDRHTSECFGMPEAAINTEVVDAVVPLPEIATVLVNLVASLPNPDERQES